MSIITITSSANAYTDSDWLPKRWIIVRDPDSEEVRCYPSIKECAYSLEMDELNVLEGLRRYPEQYLGYLWEQSKKAI